MSTVGMPLAERVAYISSAIEKAQSLPMLEHCRRLVEQQIIEQYPAQQTESCVNMLWAKIDNKAYEFHLQNIQPD